MQLVKGSGSGLHFLKALKAAELTLRPFVVVTTSKQSEAVYNLVEGLGADWFFDKLNPNYSEDLVIDTLLILRGALDDHQKKKSPGMWPPNCAVFQDLLCISGQKNYVPPNNAA